MNSFVQTLYRLFVVLKSMPKEVFLKLKRAIKLNIFSSVRVEKELSVNSKTLDLCGILRILKFCEAVGAVTVICLQQTSQKDFENQLFLLCSHKMYY